MNAIPCSICGEGEHRMQRCPTLVAPLQPGFYAPPAGHRPSGDDEEDKAAKIEKATPPTVSKSRQDVRVKTKCSI